MAGRRCQLGGQVGGRARLLGHVLVTPLRTFWRVTLPLIKNGVFAGFEFAFIVSFNDVPISLFLGRPGQVPIPIAILGHVESRFDPAVSAVAVVTIAIVLELIAVAERWARVSEFIYQQERQAWRSSTSSW